MICAHPRGALEGSLRKDLSYTLVDVISEAGFSAK